jgi:hypothetical protein
MGRLHGASRMVDLLTSTAPGVLTPDDCNRFVQNMLHTILDEESDKLMADSQLIVNLRHEIRIAIIKELRAQKARFPKNLRPETNET